MRSHRKILPAVLLLIVAGCSPRASDEPRDAVRSASFRPYVTIPVGDESQEPEFIHWLRVNKARVEKDANGDERIFDSATCRHVLVMYRRFLRRRLDVIAENMANSNTTRDAHGEKSSYRRRFVVADASGSFEIKLDLSPFPKHYEPGHPDADTSGYVLYPNVDPTIESIDAQIALREYRMITQLERYFDPTFVDNGMTAELEDRFSR